MYNSYNPYYQPQRFQPMQQPIQQPIQQIQPTTNYQQMQQQNSVLNGKQVDSLDVVKALEYPLDGSVSYFPLTDGSAIVTKQLQMDGTSRTIIYKPMVEDKKETPKYLTMNDLEDKLNDLNFKEIDKLKDEIKSLKQEIKDLKDKKKSDK